MTDTAATPSAPTAEASPCSLFRWLFLAGLLLLTALAYSSLASADFITLDDPIYLGKEQIRTGLSPGNVFWAFTHPHAGFYIPLTWLSLQLDVTLFGSSPAGYHLHNLALHLLNVILVFLILLKIFPAKSLPAFAGSVLWALHPLRVESVAWVTERKDVLAGFWGFLAILIYLHYIRKNPRRAMLLTTLAMGIATLAKPMFLTLPLLLLLLDFWPLARSEKFLRRCLEKWPLFVVAFLGSVLTTIAHIRNNTTLDFPLSLRLSNAPISYCRYLWKLFDLDHLGLLYPLPKSWPISLALGAVALLVVLTVAAVVLRRRAPWLAVGWLFFVVAFLPMIGLVQAWIQALADRFTYLPALGLSVVFAGVISLLDTRRLRPVATIFVVILAPTLAFFTHRQADYWNNSITLYYHSLAIERSAILHNLLGGSLWTQAPKSGDMNLILDRAEEQYHLALELEPDDAGITLSLARLRAYRGDLTTAETLATRAVNLDPNNAAAHFYLGQILLRLNRTFDAQSHLLRAAELDPNNATYRENRLFSAPPQ